MTFDYYKKYLKYKNKYLKLKGGDDPTLFSSIGHIVSGTGRTIYGVATFDPKTTATGLSQVVAGKYNLCYHTKNEYDCNKNASCTWNHKNTECVTK
jgi:hypothetical protein